MSNQRTEKKNRIVEIIEYYIKHKSFPKGEALKEIAERHDVSIHTIREDIRKARDNNLGDKVVEILEKKLKNAETDIKSWRNSDLIKLYQATRPKRTETKIDLKAEIDIRSQSVMDTLRELGDLKKREDIHKKRDADGSGIS